MMLFIATPQGIRRLPLPAEIDRLMVDLQAPTRVSLPPPLPPREAKP